MAGPLGESLDLTRHGGRLGADRRTARLPLRAHGVPGAEGARGAGRSSGGAASPRRGPLLPLPLRGERDGSTPGEVAHAERRGAVAAAGGGGDPPRARLFDVRL